MAAPERSEEARLLEEIRDDVRRIADITEPGGAMIRGAEIRARAQERAAERLAERIGDRIGDAIDGLAEAVRGLRGPDGGPPRR
jgi:hypothetical protein